MGLKRNSKSAEPANEPAAVDPARDAARLNPADWPARAVPPCVEGRLGGFQVVFRDSVVDDIRAHGMATPDVEVCGVLVGNIYHDDAGAYCRVEANIRGNFAPGRNAQVTFTSETWTHIHQTMDAQYPSARIVGWYHTHPGFGIFLSGMDLFIQQNFFSEPWQVAYVDDPVGGDRSVFVWRQGVAAREPYLVEPAADVLDTPPANSAQPATPHGVPSAVLDVTARVRILQRELARQRWKTRSVLIVALLWPMVLLGTLFWAGVLPRDGLKLLEPRQWMPARPSGAQPATDHA